MAESKMVGKRFVSSIWEMVWCGVYAFALLVACSASARSVTSVQYFMTHGIPELVVTLEAGEPGDAHALYIAYDTEDKGDVLNDWAALQRGCNLAVDTTSVTLPVSPLLTGAGYTVCRVFLTTATAPYDTRIESLRQTGTQYLDTGIYPCSNSVVVIDAKLDSSYPRQQRFFGVSSDDKSAIFTFDAYVNSGGSIASACQSGGGNWKGTSISPLNRVKIYLSAEEKHHAVITAEDGTELFNETFHTVCTNVSAGTLPVFAHHYFVNGVLNRRNFVGGGNLYGFILTNDGACVCNYLPCTLNGRAGMYDTVTESFLWSASGDDFEVGGGSLPCSLLDGEVPLTSSSAVDLTVASDPATGAIWKGTSNTTWNFVDTNWTIDGVASQPWLDNKAALFNDNASSFTVNVPNGTVTPASITFDNANDYTLAGSGSIAGTGTFSKYQGGKLTISGVNHSFTGDVLLAGGETVLPNDKDSSANITSASLGNPRAQRSIVVSNATLRILGKNPFAGGGRCTTPITAALKFYNSTLELTTNFCVNAGDLYLHNSDVHFHGGLTSATLGSAGGPYSGSFWGAISVANLYFSGNRAMIFSAPVTGGAENGNTAMSISKFARQGIIDVPNITGNDDVDVSIRIPIVWTSGNTAGDPGIASGFRKTGAGTLELRNEDNRSSAAYSTYTGDVDVVEGTLRMAVGWAQLNTDRASTFGAARYPHTFTVHPGATLQLAAHDTMGQFFQTNSITVHINGGTLAQSANVCNGLGHLILENAKLTYSGLNTTGADYFLDNGDGTTNWYYQLSWPTFGFNGGVEFLGTNTYSLGNGSTGGDNPRYSRLYFGTRDGKPTDIYVAEISGRGTPDTTPDVTFNVRLVDAPPWAYYENVNGKRKITGFHENLRGFPLNMRKTGPGMLSFNYNQNDFTGRVEVAEGTIYLQAGGRGSGVPCFECPTNSVLGDLSHPNLTVCVNTNAMLWISTTDTFGQANAVNHFTIAVTNGTLRQTADKANPLPFLDLYNATLDFKGALSGGNDYLSEANPWGTFVLAQRVRFDGTRPYDIQNVDGATSYFSLGWQSDSYQTPSTKSGCIEQHGKTEFYVADITQDADPDVTIGVVLKFPAHWNGNTTNCKYQKTYFRTGLLKTGPGTLRLNCNMAANKYYAEATRVNGGTLLVDAQTFNSTNIFVQTGAYVGGTGTVQRVTIEEGGGFTAAPGQTGYLTVSAFQLPVNGAVALDIPYTGESEEGLSGYRVPVVRSAGLESAQWRVTVNGADPPTGYVANAIIHNGVVYGSVSRGGTIFMIR